MKIPNRPLHAPGFHEILPSQIAHLFLDPMPLSHRRPMLIAGLLHFLNDLAATKVKCEVWIDGSFTTDKLEPNDVDVLACGPPNLQANLSADELNRFHQLIVNSGSMERYQCDVYSAETPDIVIMAYWRGWFGFMRDCRTPKGIGVILI